MTTQTKQTAHTSGPWTAVDGLSDGTRYTIEIVDSGGSSMVCRLNGTPLGEANARLIAAAPELLEACQKLLAHQGEISVSGIGTEDDSDALKEAKRLAENAINKATNP